MLKNFFRKTTDPSEHVIKRKRSSLLVGLRATAYCSVDHCSCMDKADVRHIDFKVRQIWRMSSSPT